MILSYHFKKSSFVGNHTIMKLLESIKCANWVQNLFKILHYCHNFFTTSASPFRAIIAQVPLDALTRFIRHENREKPIVQAKRTYKSDMKANLIFHSEISGKFQSTERKYIQSFRVHFK